MRSSSLSLWTLLRHRLTAYGRMPFLGRRVASLIVGILIFGGSMMEALKPLDVHMLYVGIFGTGFHILFGAADLFRYEGRHLEATAARPVSPRQRVRGRYLFVFVLSLFLFIAPLPFLLWWQSPFFFYHLAFFLYNVGVAAPLALAASTFNRTVATINEWQFVGETDIQTGRTIFVLPIFGGLALPFLLSDPAWQLALLGALGLSSALATPLWLRGLTALYRRNRHAMLEGFQASRDEQ